MSVPLLFLPLPFSIPLTFYRSSYCECDMNLRISRGFHNKSFFIFHSCMPRKPSIYMHCSYCLKLVLTERPVYTFFRLFSSVFSILYFLFFLMQIFILPRTSNTHFPVSFPILYSDDFSPTVGIYIFFFLFFAMHLIVKYLCWYNYNE